MSKAEVQLLGSKLKVGATVYVGCPWCKRPTKMGITRNSEGLLYCCFAVSCGAKGYVSDFPGEGLWAAPERPRHTRWVGKSTNPSPADLSYFAERFGISTGMLEVRVTHDDEYLFPIRNADMARIGEVIRQPVWGGDPAPPRKGKAGKPKAMTYLEENTVKLAWYPGNQQILVLTEDQLSAVKVRQVTECTAVALLGNTLSGLGAKALRAHNPGRLVIWLDPDMSAQAFSLNATWGQNFRSSTVVFSERDPKDTEPEEILSTLFD